MTTSQGQPDRTILPSQNKTGRVSQGRRGARWHVAWGIWLALIAVAAGAGCNKPVESITFPSPATNPWTIEQGQVLSVTAAVNGSANQGVSWAIQGPGTISSTSGNTIKYTAPSSVSASTTVVLSAQASANSSIFGTFQVIVTPPISVTIAPPNGNVPAGGTASFSATVIYDQNSAGVNWGLSLSSAGGGACAAATCGTLSSVTSSSVTYNAPATQPGQTIFLTATSVADPTHAASAALLIGVAQPIAVSITNPISFAIASTGAITLNATVSNDAAGNGVTWALTAGGSPCAPGCGTIANATAASVNYQPPSLPVPSAPNNTPTLTATSVDSPSATATDSFSIVANPPNTCPTGDESKLNGQYAFLVQGFQGTTLGSPAAVVASFGANGTGGITGGDIDSNSPSGYQHFTISSSGSSYTVGADPTGVGGFLGCMTVPTSQGLALRFHFALGGVGAITSGVASRGRILEFDDTNGSGTFDSGILRQQQPAAFSVSSFQPNYAFAVDGENNSGGPVALGGSFAVSSTSGGITSAVTDLNLAGTATHGTSGTGSIGAISSTTGRANATFANGIGQTYAWEIYIVNANEFFIIETDALSSGQLTSGRAIATGNSFSQASLSGNYIFHFTGGGTGPALEPCNGVPCATANLGLLNLSGGSLTSPPSSGLYTYNVSEGFSTASIQTFQSGTYGYTVDPVSGRVTLTGGTGTIPAVLYLVSPGADGSISAFFVGTDSTAAMGLVETQPSATYTVAGQAGNYILGTEDPRDQTVTTMAGAVSISSLGSVQGTLEMQNGQTGAQSVNSVGGTFALPSLNNGNGIGTMFENGSPAITNGNEIFYINTNGVPAVMVVLEKQ